MDNLNSFLIDPFPVQVVCGKLLSRFRTHSITSDAHGHVFHSKLKFQISGFEIAVEYYCTGDHR